MWKEFVICGIGMAVDLSGSHYLHTQIPDQSPNESIALDWKQVGNLIQFAVAAEHPKIEAETARQLQLKLG